MSSPARLWNVPNVLSLARLGAVPLIVLLIWPSYETPRTCFWAAVIFSLGGITDIIDGFVARRMGLVTVLGKFLDPLTDKLFYLVTLVALMQLSPPRVPGWVVMVVLVRELTITGLRAMAMSEGIVIGAGEGGKVKTTLGTAGIILLLVHYRHVVHFVGLGSPVIDFHRVGLWLTVASVAFSLTSAATYIHGFLRASQQARRPDSTT